ncbi:uncharacterized protein [Lolium perenne]|uniref:uncharacterized protein isoform X1 n=1 Tax=Lolium perenne TaxID=4522 RepID=UPI0021F66371|nr:uncharacterized protein LOC127306882 isoform X1 [Lolium perenne]
MPRRLGAASGGGQARRSEAASPLTKEDLVADRVVLITTHPGFNRWKEDAVGCHGQSSERQTAIVGAVGKKAARQHLGDLARPDTGWEALAQSVKNGFGEFACDSSRRME